MFRRIALGISGGVDSAVCAVLLKKKGFEVLPIFMRNWEKSSEDEYCDIEKDIEDATWVCDQLKLPFKVVDFSKEYWINVFHNAVKEYEKGFTPNPDIVCNETIKFDRFFNYCREELDVHAIAMGHYARSSFGCYLENYNPKEPARLLMGVDKLKDQSFFLSKISQHALQKTMFPVGNFTKLQVKQIAEDHNLHKVLKKKESMGLCFIGKRNFKKFISQYVPDKPGRFIDIDTGKVVGTHNGVHFFTIGQRSSIGGSPVAYYVIFRDSITGDIFVCAGADHPALLSSCLTASDDHWIVNKPQELIDDKVVECELRMFHRRKLQTCHIIEMNPNEYLIDLDEPIHGASPGQYAVFYKNSECLGSAKITASGCWKWYEVSCALNGCST